MRWRADEPDPKDPPEIERGDEWWRGTESMRDGFELPAIEVDFEDLQPVGTILAANGDVLAVVYPERNPIGFGSGYG